MSGFILLHRSTMKWEWYGDPNTTLVFIDLLLNASYKKNNFRGHILNPGDVIYGRKEASIRIGIGEQSIRTALNKLKSTSEITIKTTSKFSIITMVNWLKYQSENQQANQRLTNDQPATNHTQQGNNKTNNKTDDLFSDFEDFWKTYPKRTGRPDAEKKYKTALKTASHETIMQGVQNYIDHLESVRAGGFNQTAKGPAAWLNQGKWADEHESDGDAPAFTGMHPDGEHNRWKHRIENFRKNPNSWAGMWGPNPDDPDCEAPRKLLKTSPERANEQEPK